MRFSKSDIAISRQCLTNTLKQLPWLVLLCCWKPFDTWAEALQNHWSEILLYLSALNRLQWDTCKEKSDPRPVHMSENAPRRGNASAVHLQSFYSVIPATKFSLISFGCTHLCIPLHRWKMNTLKKINAVLHNNVIIKRPALAKLLLIYHKVVQYINTLCLPKFVWMCRGNNKWY